MFRRQQINLAWPEASGPQSRCSHLRFILPQDLQSRGLARQLTRAGETFTPQFHSRGSSRWTSPRAAVLKRLQTSLKGRARGLFPPQSPLCHFSTSSSNRDTETGVSGFLKNHHLCTPKCPQGTDMSSVASHPQMSPVPSVPLRAAGQSRGFLEVGHSSLPQLAGLQASPSQSPTFRHTCDSPRSSSQSSLSPWLPECEWRAQAGRGTCKEGALKLGRARHLPSSESLKDSGGEFWTVTSRTLKSLQGLRVSHMEHENSVALVRDEDNLITTNPGCLPHTPP